MYSTVKNEQRLKYRVLACISRIADIVHLVHVHHLHCQHELLASGGVITARNYGWKYNRGFNCLPTATAVMIFSFCWVTLA